MTDVPPLRIVIDDLTNHVGIGPQGGLSAP
jgi:hypothetical protein